MIEYDTKSDKELLKLYNKGDHWAFDALAKKYKETVKFHARFFYLTGGDADDLLQEGMIGLFEATVTYKDDRNASFATFADRCIRSRMIKAVNSDNKKSNRPLNTSVPIISECNQSDKDAYFRNCSKLDSDGGSGNPESIVINKELYRITVEKIKKALSGLENKIFLLYLSGKSLNDISDEIGITYKSADNALSRIKTKVKNLKDDIILD